MYVHVYFYLFPHSDAFSSCVCNIYIHTYIFILHILYLYYIHFYICITYEYYFPILMRFLLVYAIYIYICMCTYIVFLHCAMFSSRACINSILIRFLATRDDIEASFDFEALGWTYSQVWNWTAFYPLNSKPSTLNIQPGLELDRFQPPQPSTLNPQPSTLNPQHTARSGTGPLSTP